MSTGFTDGLSATTVVKRAFDPDTNTFRTNAMLTGDVQIGAVEIKDADTDVRANVITNGGQNRLLVDAGVTSVSANDIVSAVTSNTVDTIKAIYTVPVGKTLIITSFAVGTRSADILAQLQSDGNVVLDIPVSSGANSFAGQEFDVASGLGPFVAGTVIQIKRIEGLSGLAWSGQWNGYLQ